MESLKSDLENEGQGCPCLMFYRKDACDLVGTFAEFIFIVQFIFDINL